MTEDLGSLLTEALAAPDPARSPAARRLVAAGEAGFAVVEARLAASQPGPQHFILAALFSGFGSPFIGRLEQLLRSSAPAVTSAVGVALGWIGLQSATAIQRVTDNHGEPARIFSAWGLGGVMNAATRYGENDAFMVLREQIARNAVSGALFTSTAELEMNITWARAALWVFRNRDRFRVGTATPRGMIGETGLPHQVQVLAVGDWKRASLIQTWLINTTVMEQEELAVLAKQWGSHSDPAGIALHWGRGALWALRELSREEVRSTV